MEEWVEDNKDVVLNSLYENLPEFIEGEEATKLVLKLIVKPPFQRGRVSNEVMAFEFMLVKNELEETMEGLLKHYVEKEEYEKCAELVKMKDKYQKLKEPVEIVPIKKRGRKPKK